MSASLKRVLAGVAWALMILGPVLGLWMIFDIVSGSHRLLGDPLFVLRQLMTLMVSVLAPVAQGAVLWLAVRIYERILEART